MGHKFLRKTKLERMRQSLFLALGKPHSYVFCFFVFVLHRHKLSVGPNHTAFLADCCYISHYQKKIKNQLKSKL